MILIIVKTYFVNWSQLMIDNIYYNYNFLDGGFYKEAGNFRLG